MIRNGLAKWKALQPCTYSDETQMQKMLHDSPELIPLATDDAVAVFIREAGLPGSGTTDLLGVDSTGNILIVETKLAKNQESRRKVVGQILEYAAYLWGMSFDDFDSLFARKRGKSILPILTEFRPDLVVEQVRKTICENLANGKFQLLIAVDAINDELERIITYFAECGGGIQLEALEMELYKDGETQVLVPRRYGTRTGKPPTTRLLTLQEFLAQAKGVAAERLQQVVQLWGGDGCRIDPGTVGASFKAEIAGKFQPIFWAYPESLQGAFNELTTRGAPEDCVLGFRKAAASLQAFGSFKAMNAAQPMAKLTDLSVEDIRAFVGAAQRTVSTWRESVGCGTPSSL